MAYTVANLTTWATNTFKGVSLSTADELSIANNVQNAIVGRYRWLWTLTAGANISVSSGTQEYNLAAADQDKVLEIADANLLSGSTDLPALIVQSDPVVPISEATGQPIGVSLLSSTRLRLWPTPGASYTFQWRYYARPVVFTNNTDQWTIPDNFANVSRAGVVWQLAQFLDDDRAESFRQQFDALLQELVDKEAATAGRHAR